MLKDEPKEVDGFPGFYEIPGFGNYAISRQGVVINLRADRKLVGSTNTNGYHHYRIRKDGGDFFTIGRHRLLGFVFKGAKKTVLDRVINHLNGIKGDDDLDNLEWTTYQGNAEHAGKLGLTQSCLPIVVRDVESGKETEYPSMVECARHFGVTEDFIHYRVRSGGSRVFPEKKQYRLAKIEGPWFVPENVEMALLKNGTSKKARVKYVLTGEVFEFDQLTKLAEFLKIPPPTLTLWLKATGQPVLPGYIQLKKAEDTTPWRIVEDPYRELDRYTGKRSVVITHAKSRTQTIFSSSIECAKLMGLSATTLHYRLQSKGMVAFSDGYMYSYYSDKV